MISIETTRSGLQIKPRSDIAYIIGPHAFTTLALFFSSIYFLIVKKNQPFVAFFQTFVK